MAQPARLTDQAIQDEALATSRVRWGTARASVLQKGDRRLEAHTYLSDGYGLRMAVESRPSGWSRVEAVARVWQPSRLRGIVVPPEHGTPFLAAGQVFEARPAARKWLSLSRTPGASDRFVQHGTLLVSCSGNVGRVTVARAPHMGSLITHDLLRVDPKQVAVRGWLYAYMRTSLFKAMAKGAHYGHMIKHLEPAHLSAMPLISVGPNTQARFEDSLVKVLTLRDEVFNRTLEAEKLYADQFPSLPSSGDAWHSVQSGALFGRRRRLDAHFHSPRATAVDGLIRSARKVETLEDVSQRVWWPARFRRFFAENGTPYASAEQLFDLNAPVTKRVHAGLIPNKEDYLLEPGWLLMARSGQTYGLIGQVMLATERHQQFIVSEDLIRAELKTEVVRRGYVLTALSHPILGRPLVIRHAYGTSIPHLEPFDIGAVPLPRLGEKVESQIAELAEAAADASSAADKIENEMTSEAEEIAEEFIHSRSPQFVSRP